MNAEASNAAATSPDAQSPEATPHLFERVYCGSSGERIEFHVDARHRSYVRHVGKGTMEGVHASLEMFEDAIRIVGEEHPSEALVDISALYGAPLRGQFVLGRWLLRKKHLVARIAVFGGPAWEMRLARAVAKIAGLSKVSGFFKDEQSALRYLGW